MRVAVGLDLSGKLRSRALEREGCFARDVSRAARKERTIGKTAEGLLAFFRTVAKNGDVRRRWIGKGALSIRGVGGAAVWRGLTTARPIVNKNAALVDADDAKRNLIVMREVVAASNGGLDIFWSVRKITKYQLALETRLSLRDLRPFTNYTEGKRQIGTIVVRPTALLVNIKSIQAIIDASTLRLFNLGGDKEYDQMKQVLDKIESSSAETFELRCLDAILTVAVERLEEEHRLVSKNLQGVLEKVISDRSFSNLWDLREISDVVEAFEACVDQTLKAVQDVLSSDEDMAMMYLTKFASGISQPVSEHAEVEMLLESFDDQLQELENSAVNMRNRITNAEQFIGMSVDAQRNRIIRLNLYVAIASFGTSTASAMTSVFGMNLTSGLEHSPHAFLNVLTAIGMVVTVILAQGLWIAWRTERATTSRWNSRRSCRGIV
ncbi:uncharacterized protein LOC126332387 [Schistocerca gregaria]|uniref:uncharacterized protein LOC126332387 n=1 Tax=Schistocerca gregaria TaxID=7010 RepID=UPI00211EA261|nr:uncharacterized protein LOC126332387 [Schistocerca gregaria]